MKEGSRMPEDSMPTKNTPDMVLPFSFLKSVIEYKDFVLITPYSINYKFTDYHRIVKIVGVDDDAFYEYGPSIGEDKALAHIFYDVTQIRECQASQIKPIEWYKNIGSRSLSEWMTTEKKGPNTSVRVYYLKKVDYNLKSFNKQYKKDLM